MSATGRRALRSAIEGVISSAIIIAVMMLSGVVPPPRAQVDSALAIVLEDLKTSFAADAGSVSATNVWLANDISRTVSRELVSRGISFKDMRDDRELLDEIQREALPSLLFAMGAAKCSGAYFFLFTTANSHAAPDAINGIYLKFDSILSQVTIDRDVMLFRGDPAISRERSIALHGAWEMQCDDEIASELRRAASSDGERPQMTPRPWSLSRSVALPGTWERVRLWSAPIIDMSSGEVIGVCGYEMSDIYLMHLYPSAGPIVSRLFDDASSDPSAVIDGMAYVRADHRITVGSGGSARGLTLSAMMPQSVADGIIRRAVLALIGAFVGIAVLVSGALFLARYLIMRQVSISIREIISGSEERSPAVVAEIDDLWEFLASRDQQWAAEIDLMDARLSAAASSDPHDDAIIVDEEVHEAVDEFSGRLDSLTPREREIFDLYLEGKKASEISEALFISYSTMKFHNRNIYSKLGVTSKRELLELIRLLRAPKRGSST